VLVKKGEVSWKLVTMILALVLLVVAVGLILFFRDVGLDSSMGFLDNLISKVG